MKNVFIDATLPELKGGAMYQVGRGTGTSAKVALARAFGQLLKQPKVKGKRISTIRATITITEATKKEESIGEPEADAIA